MDAGPLIDVQGVGLPPGAVEGEHELAGNPFSRRLLSKRRLEFPNELGMVSELQFGLDARLECDEAHLLEPAKLRLGKVFKADLGQGRAAP